MSFSQNIPYQAIRVYGAWASDAIWQYVKHTNKVTLIVPWVGVVVAQLILEVYC